MSTSAGSSKAPIEDAAGTQADDWVRAAARTADDKLGQDTVVIAVGDLLAITDHFVITNGANRRQVKAITEAVEEGLTAAGGPKPLRIEGLQDLDWVLMDYGEFVVHVFDSDTRSIYDLERLWGDCPTLDWQAGNP
jgi:ribosome-associated protein